MEEQQLIEGGFIYLIFFLAKAAGCGGIFTKKIKRCKWGRARQRSEGSPMANQNATTDGWRARQVLLKSCTIHMYL
jgi:hypothetical protein